MSYRIIYLEYSDGTFNFCGSERKQFEATANSDGTEPWIQTDMLLERRFVRSLDHSFFFRLEQSRGHAAQHQGRNGGSRGTATDLHGFHVGCVVFLGEYDIVGSRSIWVTTALADPGRVAGPAHASHLLACGTIADGEFAGCVHGRAHVGLREWIGFEGAGASKCGCGCDGREKNEGGVAEGHHLGSKAF